MNLQARINALAELGKRLNNLEDDRIETAIRRTANQNSWFTADNQRLALTEIRDHFLQKNALENWISAYKIGENTKNTEGSFSESKAVQSLQTSNFKLQSIGLVLAGNIPLVGFHDILCVFMAGHKAVIKLSDKDPFLLPMLLGFLNEIDDRTAAYFSTTTERLSGFDAVIATGSNNSARYFEAYFGKYPNIIRKNRNAVAILRGPETAEELRLLGNDIFQYFGLGCRNVSKLYVPRVYNFTLLLETLHERNDIVLHDKYKNNFDYNFTLLILNKIKYESNGCLLMREAEEIASPISVVYYEFYDDLAILTESLQAKKDEIQLVVAASPVDNLTTFNFGEAQKPSLVDYADGVDTMQFLCDLK
jgi:Acyl-CoA reductase (LuxC)